MVLHRLSALVVKCFIKGVNKFLEPCLGIFNRNLFPQFQLLQLLGLPTANLFGAIFVKNASWIDALGKFGYIQHTVLVCSFFFYLLEGRKTYSRNNQETWFRGVFKQCSFKTFVSCLEHLQCSQNLYSVFLFKTACTDLWAIFSFWFNLRSSSIAIFLQAFLVQFFQCQICRESLDCFSRCIFSQHKHEPGGNVKFEQFSRPGHQIGFACCRLFFHSPCISYPRLPPSPPVSVRRTIIFVGCWPFIIAKSTPENQQTMQNYT